MYKGRFDKSGGRSTADILRERAAGSSAAPQIPAPPAADPMQQPVFPQNGAPNLNFNFQMPSQPQPETSDMPMQAPEDPFLNPPVQAQNPDMAQRPPMAPQNPGMSQRPPMPPQNPGMPQRPPIPTQNPGMPQRPPMPPQNPGMPQRPPMPNPGIPRPPVRPQVPGTATGPGGMPIRPGYRPQPGQPGVPPQRPGTPPVRPGQKPPMAPVPGQKPPAKQPPVKTPEVPAADAKEGVRKSSVVFYSCYFGFIFLFFVITFCGLTWLKGWLTDYEAAQPYTMADQIFKQNFENPNWKVIYQNSTSFATNPDDCDAYVAMMEDKVGSSQLTYQETSAGLSGDKKYFIKLGDERIASFTLVGDSEFITDIPDWKLGSIELMVKYDNNYRIQMQEGHKAYVNDKLLDDSYTIMKASTMAQEYLPVGTKGVRIWTQEVTGLMGKPTVRIQDEKGQEMEVAYDAETHTFTEQTKANTMTQEQQDAAIGAAKVYGRYMIAQAGRGELAKFFDSSSKIYASIRDSEKIVQQAFFSSYDFGTPEITNFCMYSDDLFSARVSVNLNVTRKDGTVKPFPINTTLFFSQHSTGKWLAYDMTNEDVLSQPIGQVRITFNSTDGTQIASDFYDTNAKELDTPMITVPEGKVFSGWVRENVSEDGKRVLEVKFTPDETGHVVLNGGAPLEPMVLTPLFENKTTEGGN